MVTLTLSHSDAAVLTNVLESYLGELRMEISHTDSKDFRDGLKDRKAALRRVLEALREKAA